MTNDGERGARVDEHFSRRAAGMRALFGMVDVLSADRETGNRSGRPLDQDRGNAKRDIHPWILMRRGCDRGDLREVG